MQQALGDRSHSAIAKRLVDCRAESSMTPDSHFQGYCTEMTAPLTDFSASSHPSPETVPDTGMALSPHHPPPHQRKAGFHMGQSRAMVAAFCRRARYHSFNRCRTVFAPSPFHRAMLTGHATQTTRVASRRCRSSTDKGPVTCEILR